MSINNIPIIGKVLIVLSFFGLLTIGSTIFSASKMHAIDDGYSAAMDHEASVALYLARASRAFSVANGAIADLEIAVSDADNQKALDQLKGAREAFIKSGDAAKAADVANAYNVGDLVAEGLNVVDKLCAKAVKMGAEGSTPEATLAAQAEYLKSCAPEFPPVVTKVAGAVDHAESTMKKINDDLSDVTNKTVLTSYLAVLGGLALVAACSWFALARWVSRPIAQLIGTMRGLADGDLSVNVEGADRRDELGRMAGAVQVFKDNGLKLRDSEAAAAHAQAEAEAERRRNETVRAQAAAEQAEAVRRLGEGLRNLAAGDLTSRLHEGFSENYAQVRDDFNQAIDKLKQTMVSVVSSASAIQSGTQQVSVASDEMSRRTEQQAASLEETAAALDEITATVKRSAEGAKHAREVVVAADEDAKKSAVVVREAVEAMDAIAKSAQQISQIIGVIDEIAFQTNLLALNAGVEAARAGEAGRGFAVVASEVRALAQRSAEAAKEIKGLISASTTQVGHGVNLVAETGKSLDRIMAQVSEINTVVTEIAAGAQEQATGLQQINTAINQMDQTTQQNASMAEESTAASHSLSQETDQLSGLIGQFQVGSDGDDSLRRQLQRAAPHAFRQSARAPTGSKSEPRIAASHPRPDARKGGASPARPATKAVVNGASASEAAGDWTEF